MFGSRVSVQGQRKLHRIRLYREGAMVGRRSSLPLYKSHSVYVTDCLILCRLYKYSLIKYFKIRVQDFVTKRMNVLDDTLSVKYGTFLQDATQFFGRVIFPSYNHLLLLCFPYFISTYRPSYR